MKDCGTPGGKNCSTEVMKKSKIVRGKIFQKEIARASVNGAVPEKCADKIKSQNQSLSDSVSLTLRILRKGERKCEPDNPVPCVPAREVVTGSSGPLSSPSSSASDSSRVAVAPPWIPNPARVRSAVDELFSRNNLLFLFCIIFAKLETWLNLQTIKFSF